MKTVLSLGSNLGDRAENLAKARDLLGELPSFQIENVSSIYETEPFGAIAQPDFLNQIVIAETELPPERLLENALCIEAQLGRQRVIDKGPRTVDIDLIQMGKITADTPNLVLPHPRAAERAFVLVPWAEIDPKAVLAGVGPISEILARLDLSGVRLYG